VPSRLTPLAGTSPDDLSMTDLEHPADQHDRSTRESRRDRDRILEAMHDLETAVGSAASRRNDGWKMAVDAALARLEVAFAEQRASYDDPASLMLQIAQDDPRLRTFVRQLHHRWDELTATRATHA
jgi:hypothetical protein